MSTLESRLFLLLTNHLQTISWIPADVVANTYVDLVLSEGSLPTTLNLVHPHPVKWQDVVRSLNSALGKHPLDVIPYADWLAKVEDLPVNSLNIERFVSICFLELPRIAYLSFHSPL